VIGLSGVGGSGRGVGAEALRPSLDTACIEHKFEYSRRKLRLTGSPRPSTSPTRPAQRAASTAAARTAGAGRDAGKLDAGELDAGELDAGELDAGELDADSWTPSTPSSERARSPR